MKERSSWVDRESNISARQGFLALQKYLKKGSWLRRNVTFFVLELNVYDPRVVWFFVFVLGFFYTFDSVAKYTDSGARNWGEFILIQPKGLGVFVAEMKN